MALMDLMQGNRNPSMLNYVSQQSNPAFRPQQTQAPGPAQDMAWHQRLRNALGFADPNSTTNEQTAQVSKRGMQNDAWDQITNAVTQIGGGDIGPYQNLQRPWGGGPVGPNQDPGAMQLMQLMQAMAQGGMRR